MLVHLIPPSFSYDLLSFLYIFGIPRLILTDNERVKMNKVIVTDMDDVLVDLLPTWVKVLNERHHLTVKVTDIIEWDMGKAFPTLCPQEIFSVLSEDDFWSIVPPRKDAVTGLQKLREKGYIVYVCTATHYKNMKTKIDNCLFKHFPYLSYKDIIMSHNKQLIDCDYIIDDYPENIRGHKAISFLMSAPHNKNCDEMVYDFRVDNFNDIIKVIEELEVVESE